MNKKLIPILIGFIIAVSEAATDVYAPNLPVISEFFKVNEELTTLTMSLYLIGIALSALIYGPLSDYYGRKPILTISLYIFTFGNFLGLFANSIGLLIFIRFIQGIGAGSALILGMSIINDLYDTKKSSKVWSKVSLVMGLSSAVTPIIGSFIAKSSDWKLVFNLLAFISFLILLFTYKYLPETNRNLSKQFSLKNIIIKYRIALNNRHFLIFAFIKVITIFWFLGEISNLPFIYLEGMNLPVEQYGYFYAFGVGMYILGNIFNKKYVTYYGVNKMLQIGIYLTLTTGVSLIVSSYFFTLTPIVAQVLKIPAGIGLALILDNATVKALEYTNRNTGAHAALMGASEMLFGSLGVIIISQFYNGTMLPIGIMITTASLIAFILNHYKRNFI
ncbi:MAG: multidrug effflux MFS transporter [Sphingobacteriia bacterium]|nr:multidrug effflux MFS transporter [Sphingobacteriia bacterium]